MRREISHLFVTYTCNLNVAEIYLPLSFQFRATDNSDWSVVSFSKRVASPPPTGMNG